MTRKWREYGPRFLEKGAVALALTGVGSAVMGTSAIAGPAAPVVLGFGGIITAGSFLWTVVAGVQAIPESIKKAVDEIGKYKLIDELDQIEPIPLKLGFIGRSRVGKSSLLNLFCEIPEDKEKSGKNKQGDSTEVLYAYIHSIFYEEQGGNSQILAVIDGSGGGKKKRDYQLFKIAEDADILCIILDHTSQGYDQLKQELYEIPIDQNRLKEHEDFLETLKEYLEENINESKKKKKLQCIHFLMNKKNYWKKEDENNLQNWFDDVISDWKDNGKSLSNQISGTVHSNRSSGDIQALRNLIRNVIISIN